MLASERLMYIIDQVNQKRIVNLKEISANLNVSETTIRRDFEKLEKEGKLVRVHGGAKKIENPVILTTNNELSMYEKLYLNSDQKRAICQKAASFVKDGDCVFIDGGTSISPMMEFLADKQIKIVTHSTLFLHNPTSTKAEITFIGGKYIPNYNMSVGPITMHALEQFNFDHAFIGCAGINLEKKQVYTAEMDTLAVKEKAMELSLNSYLLFDTSKINIRGFCSFADYDAFDILICNNDDCLKTIDIPDNLLIV